MFSLPAGREGWRSIALPSDPCQSFSVINCHFALQYDRLRLNLIDLTKGGRNHGIRKGEPMHERERHRIILSALQERAVVTVQDVMEYTSACEATVRRDIAALADEGRLRKVRGGAEAIHPTNALTARTFRQNQSLNLAQKRAIARAA